VANEHQYSDNTSHEVFNSANSDPWCQIDSWFHCNQNSWMHAAGLPSWKE